MALGTVRRQTAKLDGAATSGTRDRRTSLGGDGAQRGVDGRVGANGGDERAEVLRIQRADRDALDDVGGPGEADGGNGALGGGDVNFGDDTKLDGEEREYALWRSAEHSQ